MSISEEQDGGFFFLEWVCGWSRHGNGVLRAVRPFQLAGVVAKVQVVVSEQKRIYEQWPPVSSEGDDRSIWQ